MYYVKNILRGLFVLIALGLSACNEITDDLNPSGEDKRPDVVANSIGYMPGQIAADFTIKTSLDDDFVLTDYLAGGSQPVDAVILYFTMWCPVCLTHSDHMFNTVIPQFETRGEVVYALVDYVSGSVLASRAIETANGYAGSDFITLVDVGLDLKTQFNAGMGSVVVISAEGVILLNEDYRSGDAIQEVLDEYLP